MIFRAVQRRSCGFYFGRFYRSGEPEDHEASAVAGTDNDSKALAPADPVARYLSEIRKYALLTREKEQELAIRYRETGDPKAAEQLVTSNLRFVVKVAAEYSKFGARLIDLVQEGNVGLMHAVKEFNPYKGTRLITYAVWWIRGYIQEYLMRQYSMVRIGTTATQKKLFYQLQREKEKLERMGLEAGIKQLSGKLGVSEEDVQNMQQRLSGRDVSLDQPISEDGSGRLIDFQTETAPGALDDELGIREQLQQPMRKRKESRPSCRPRKSPATSAKYFCSIPGCSRMSLSRFKKSAKNTASPAKPSARWKCD